MSLAAAIACTGILGLVISGAIAVQYDSKDMVPVCAFFVFMTIIAGVFVSILSFMWLFDWMAS